LELVTVFPLHRHQSLWQLEPMVMKPLKIQIGLSGYHHLNTTDGIEGFAPNSI
jgi:hypothetical protein